MVSRQLNPWLGVWLWAFCGVLPLYEDFADTVESSVVNGFLMLTLIAVPEQVER